MASSVHADDLLRLSQPLGIGGILLGKFSREEIQAMLIIPEPFKKTHFHQDLVAVGRQEGIQ
ncbi:MAG: hypothetical protein Q6M54_04665 [Thermostichus sp. DRC_bins_24]